MGSEPSLKNAQVGGGEEGGISVVDPEIKMRKRVIASRTVSGSIRRR